MSNAIMSTGSIPMRSGESSDVPPVKKAGNAFHLLVMADFSGRGHRGLTDVVELASRKIHSVDRDELDALFARMAVTLATPLSEEPLTFRELDELHPDYLYDNLSIFGRFRALKRKLGKKETFAEAAREMAEWGAHKPSVTKAAPATAQAEAAPPVDSMLEGILDGATRAASSETFDVQALVREIVAPYVEDAPHPEQKSLQRSVDEAAGDLLRKLMHHRVFQHLESAWRGLDLLLRRIEDDTVVKVYVVDVSRPELQAVADEYATAAQSESPKAADSALAKLLTVTRQSAGLPAFDAVLADYLIAANEADMHLLSYLSDVVSETGARLLGGALPDVAGCPDLVAHPDPVEWVDSRSEAVRAQWAAFRTSPGSALTALVCPRYLQRLPYGKKTATTHSLPFEELPARQAHGFYLWGNGAWLLAISLLQRFVREGAQFNGAALVEVDRLPLHVHQDDEGDPAVTPCGEVLMTDVTAQALAQAGLTLLRSVRDGDRVQLPGYFAAAEARSVLP